MTNPFLDQLAELQTKIDEAKRLEIDPDFAELAQAELAQLSAQKQMLEEAVAQMQPAANREHDDNQTGKRGACTIEIRGGAGGDEAKIWANDLLRMYVRFAEMKKLRIEFIDDLIIKISGKTFFETDSASPLTPFEIFCYESGVHRVQRVPETEAQGRIHTSTASVAVLPEIPAGAVEIRDEDLEWQFMRSSGAGGQSVNKTSSAVRLTHHPSGIVVTARQEKKQEQNRKIALDLLRAQLWEIEEEKRQQEIGAARSVIGRNRRAEKIRTYNYPQNRVTDHRTKQSWYNLPEILEGNLETMITEIKATFEKISTDQYSPQSNPQD